LRELPKGWSAARLATIGDWGSGGTPKRTNPAYYDGGNIPWLVIGDLNDGIVTEASSYITPLGLANSSAKLIPPNTLLVAMYGSIGKLGITGIECATNQAIAYCRPNAAANLRYLFYSLMHAKADLISQGQGGAQQNISQTVLKAHAIRLAPLAEQEHLVAKLDVLVDRIHACRSRLNRVPLYLKRFREAVLEAAVSGKLTDEWRRKEGASANVQSIALEDETLEVPEGWQACKLADAISDSRPLCYGVVQPGAESENGQQLVRVQDIERGRIAIDELRTISAAVDREYQRSRIQSGDLLISVVGSIGRTAVVPDGFKANIARAIARIAPRDGVDSKWLRIWLDSVKLQWWLLRTAKEVARKTLNLSDLERAPLALPSLTEQREIVRRVYELFALANDLEQKFQTAFKRVEKLTPAILAKAFDGELVPQDPSDEPASMLLERVRKQKESAVSRSKGPRIHTRVMGDAIRVNDPAPKVQIEAASKLSVLLKKSGRLSPESLLQASGFDIDSFYAQLKLEMTAGRIREIRKGKGDEQRWLEAAQ
jgi:type I restriction enzyme, S subunit